MLGMRTWTLEGGPLFSLLHPISSLLLLLLLLPFLVPVFLSGDLIGVHLYLLYHTWSK